MLDRIIIEEDLDGLPVSSPGNYLAHILCVGGRGMITYNNKEYVLKEGALMIVMKGKNITRINTSTDFKVKVLYVEMSLIRASTPQSNYGVKGLFSLISDPLMQLTQVQSALCGNDIDNIAMRLKQTDHNFHREAIRNALRTALLDFFDFHSRLYGTGPISLPKAAIIERFFQLLEEGSYREHRDVSYYADRLCVTSKYLSETSKKISGYPAMYWINLYTGLEIARALRDKSLTFMDISEQFHFSSLSHFTLYVQRHLGMSPGQYRACVSG